MDVFRRIPGRRGLQSVYLLTKESQDERNPDGQFAPFDLLPQWDYLALAQAFGVKGYRLQTVQDLRSALPELKALAGMPALVEVAIPQKDLAPQLKRLAEPPVPVRKYGRNLA